MPNGLLNVSACKFQAPAFVSYPHFYLADESLLEQFNQELSDLSPDPSKHESYLSLDPNSGIPLEVAVRMQINALARPLNYITEAGNLSIRLATNNFPNIYS